MIALPGATSIDWLSRSGRRITKAMESLVWGIPRKASASRHSEVPRPISLKKAVVETATAAAVRRWPAPQAGAVAGGGTSLASLRRFWAVAASGNSSRAPLGPRRRSQSSFRMRLRWAHLPCGGLGAALALVGTGVAVSLGGAVALGEVVRRVRSRLSERMAARPERLSGQVYWS